MAMLKYGNAALVTRVVDPDKWGAAKVATERVKVAKEIFAKYNPDKWLLSHLTVLASVDVDGENKDPKKNYLIKPDYSMFVNNNGDSWERGMTKACYKTFLGADNFLEHVQLPELSKGKIIDVALRDVPFKKDSDGKDLNTLYVDVLVATNRKHSDLIDKIESREYSACSMGCQILFSVCSQCGNVAEDEAHACKHVRFFKNNYFYDKNGVKRIIAELCGSSDQPDSCRFIDCSWVRKPAFEGAVLRNLVQPQMTEDLAQKFQIALAVPSFKPEPGMLLRAASQAAQQIVNEIEAAEDTKPKTDRFGQDAPAAPAPAAPAAEAPPAEAPASDSGFPTAPTDTKSQLELDTPPTGDAPPADAGAPPTDPAADPALGAAPAGGEAPMFGGGGGAPAAPAEPQIQEPPEDATVSEIKNMMKKQVLNDIRRDMLKQQARTQETERPTGMENASNDNMIKKAFFKKVYANAKNVRSERLRNGIMLMANVDNWEKMKRYGYDRNDMLAMLCHIDRTISTEPVGTDAVKAMSKIKLGSDGLKGLFTELIVETGRKPTKVEAHKIASWARILSHLER